MPIQVNWADENKYAVHWRFEGAWTSDEFFEAIKKEEACKLAIKER